MSGMRALLTRLTFWEAIQGHCRRSKHSRFAVQKLRPIEWDTPASKFWNCYDWLPTSFNVPLTEFTLCTST
ncbi:hypothetical protein DFH06DRAFT_1185027 [Mycena polygramma]|nr:hypothetical protein DFH06DRAFT_1185027 [Mycena polygramma]